MKEKTCIEDKFCYFHVILFYVNSIFFEGLNIFLYKVETHIFKVLKFVLTFNQNKLTICNTISAY